MLYCEGIATVDGAEQVMVPHAWLISRHGLVIDPTWGGGGRLYLGLAISLYHSDHLSGADSLLQSIDDQASLPWAMERILRPDGLRSWLEGGSIHPLLSEVGVGQVQSKLFNAEAIGGPMQYVVLAMNSAGSA